MCASEIGDRRKIQVRKSPEKLTEKSRLKKLSGKIPAKKIAGKFGRINSGGGGPAAARRWADHGSKVSVGSKWKDMGEELERN